MKTLVSRVYDNMSGFVRVGKGDLFDTGRLEIKLTEVNKEYFTEVVFYGQLLPIQILYFEKHSAAHVGFQYFENHLVNYANA